jgi:hypothetical protein
MVRELRGSKPKQNRLPKNDFWDFKCGDKQISQ